MSTDRDSATSDNNKEIAYSRTVKAGKRVYYLDVKRSRNEDLYLCLTESKKKTSGNAESPEISFEKHKIFLYKEDLAKFTEALIDVIRFMQDNDDTTLSLDDNEPAIKLNLEDFE